MRRRIVLAFFCAVYLLTALPVEAQTTSPAGSDRATGENYRVEIGGFIWNPDPQIAIQSQALGIVGTRIDFIDDLGLEQTRFNQLKVVLRPATKHKFRFEYTPINYEQPDGILKRNITFNGISYNVALPVSTTLKWNAFRFGYEWDFVYQDRGFVGLVLEAKYTDVEATLSNVLDTEYVRARAPIPAIGVIGRVYPAANISITGEFSAFKLPESIDEDYRGSFYDFDLYGTININDHVGGQIGYRTFSVFYHVDDDEGEMKLRGLYFGGVFRF